MTVGLDEAVRVGKAVVAALSMRSVASGHQGGPWIAASKRPLALLVRHDGRTLASGVDGAPVALGELERRHPGMRAEFEARAAAITG